MATYATTPPILPTTFENSHGMRFWQANVLKILGNKYNVNEWTKASTLFRQSGENIMKLCEATLKQDKQSISNILLEIADIEEEAYKLLKTV
jgi:hypothetical protein